MTSLSSLLLMAIPPIVEWMVLEATEDQSSIRDRGDIAGPYAEEGNGLTNHTSDGDSGIDIEQGGFGGRRIYGAQRSFIPFMSTEETHEYGLKDHCTEHGDRRMRSSGTHWCCGTWKYVTTARR